MLARLVAEWAEQFPTLAARGYETSEIDGQVVYFYELDMEHWKTLPEDIRCEYRRAYLRLHGGRGWDSTEDDDNPWEGLS